MSVQGRVSELWGECAGQSGGAGCMPGADGVQGGCRECAGGSWVRVQGEGEGEGEGEGAVVGVSEGDGEGDGERDV